MRGHIATHHSPRSFRPDHDRIPSEFKFWLQATRATLISIGLTITRASDVCVEAPISRSLHGLS